jgi:apolipoprotein D and lipocalin family protein
MDMDKEKELRTVAHVDLQKFMGDWYVIANIPTFVEEGAVNAIEGYHWNESEKRIDVDYRHNKDSPQGELKKAPQKAWVYNENTNAEWRVQPWWPFKFAYLIIDLAPDYSYTVVGVPSRKYVWIMARKPSLPEATYNKLVEGIKAQGYDISKLRKVPQIWN